MVEELKEVERRVSDAGRETYEISRADGHHADTCYAAAMALLIAERRVGRQSRTVSMHAEGGHHRKPGRPRQGNAAKRVIDARLEQSRKESERSLWRQIEEPTAFD